MGRQRKSPRVAGWEDEMSSKTKVLLQISLRTNGKLRVTFATYAKDGPTSTSGEMSWEQVEKLLPLVMPAGTRALKAGQRHQAAFGQGPAPRLDPAGRSASQAQCKPLTEAHGHCPSVQCLAEVKARPLQEPGTTVEISIGSPVEPSFRGHLQKCRSAFRGLVRSIWSLLLHPVQTPPLRNDRPSKSPF